MKKTTPKRPNPNLMGTGAAAQAGKKAVERNTRTKDRLDNIMGEIQTTRGKKSK